jgi:hypothetical protein
MIDYSTLVSVISDVGYWRWWSERLPELFQLEFGGVQIYVPSDDKTKPPSGLLALRFLRPSRVSFIQRKIGTDGLPPDWPRQLKDEKIEPFGVSYDQFALGDDALFSQILGQTVSEQVHFTDSSGGEQVKFAFWAGVAGVRIEAADVRPVLMSGETQLSTIASLHGDWWSYWRDYWKKRETADALPVDYACEVTIPLKQE